MECPVCHKSSDFFTQKNNYKIYKCNECKLGFVYPIPTLKEVTDYYNSRNYYESTDHGYLNYSSLENGMKETYRGFVERVENKYKLKLNNKNVLDIGCAYGYFLDVAKEAGAGELWGIDISRDAEDLVKSKGHKFFPGAFENVDFPLQHFDLIYMGDVFEHLMDPFATVKKLNDVLKPGGVVIVSTLDFNSLFVQVVKEKWRLITPPEHIFYWTKKSIQKLFEDYRFRGSFITSIHHLPKSYLMFRFKKQFGFSFFPLYLYPFETLPIPGFDTMTAIFQKPKE